MCEKNPKYTCVYCDYSATQAYMMNHYLTHLSEIKKSADKYNLNSACNNGLPLVLKMKQEKSTLDVCACFCCNKFYSLPRMGMAKSHLASCKDKKVHIEKCKEIKQSDEEQVTEVGNNSDLVKQLQEQIKKLKRELEHKDEELADCQQKVDAFDGLVECIYEKIDEEERDDWRDWLKSNKEGIEWEDYL